MLLTLDNTTQKDIHFDLVQACKRGERKAQHQIYKLYSKAMYNICMRMTNNTADAEDVLQEAFIDAFRKIHTFKAESTFGAWLKRIVINKSINHLKKRRIDFVEMENYEFGDEDNRLDEEHLHFKVNQVHKAIQDLPNGFRTVLTMYLLEGYDHREISQFLGISESTSKSQYNRAKKKLLKILRSDE